MVATSCGSKPADLHTFIPADSLVYLESNDLGAVMKAITERPAFREAAKTVPDFSALNGVKMAVAVTGFESKEIPVTDENAVLSFQPRFVAILETNAWNFQALSFTENKLGEFINQVYGGEVVLETSDKNDGKYFVWGAKDGRKAFALVQGSLVFFGNDESAIEKSLAVKRGEADSIANNPKITDGDRLAFGYVSQDGVAQIANIAGLTLAKSSSEESAVQGFIARVLPTILRNSLTDATWTSNKTEVGIEDKLIIATDPYVGNVFAQTIVRPSGPYLNSNLLPAELASVTLYSLNDPQIAWRSLVLTAQKQTDEISGKLLAAFSSSIFETYGIEEPEQFLKSIDRQIITARFDSEGEKSVVIAAVKDVSGIKSAIAEEINFSKPPEKTGSADVWRSDDADYAAAFVDTSVVLGDPESVLACLRINSEKASGYPLQFSNEKFVSITFDRDLEVANKIAEIVSERKSDAKVGSTSITETGFGRNRIERRSVSDFGIVGWMILQFAKDE